MPALSFNSLEILPALLDKSKTQTIRPLQKIPIYLALRLMKKHGCGEYKEPRLKVGDEVTLYWKQRTSPSDAWFCCECGEMTIKHLVKDRLHCHLKKDWKTFKKTLGKVKITEVFEIEMGTTDVGSSDDYLTLVTSSKNGDPKQQELAKRDGFKSVNDMAEWFHKNYGLDKKKIFAVYRWEWFK